MNTEDDLRIKHLQLFMNDKICFVLHQSIKLSLLQMDMFMNQKEKYKNIWLELKDQWKSNAVLSRRMETSKCVDLPFQQINWSSDLALDF